MTDAASPEPHLPTLPAILARRAADAGFDDDARSLLWAAYDSDEALTRAVAGARIEPPAAAEPRAARPVWLSSIAVEGFRGIGPPAELLISAQPGLTLVVGRNGSGKSSFAEALEALLTGDNLRWRDRPRSWQDGWRNLHHDGPTVVAAELQLEGDTAPTRLERRWGASFTESTLTAGPAGTPVTAAELGWDEALTNHKPFLSYNELGSMLEQSPSTIYDSMAAVLGLDRLTEARDRLRLVRLDAEKPTKEVTRARKALLDDLTAAADSPTIGSRAAEARAALAARRPDLAQLEALAFGEATGPTDEIGGLVQALGLDPIAGQQAAAELVAARDRRALAAETDAARSGRVAALLRQALDVHQHDGDGRCPVCGAGTLDAAWRARVDTEAAALEALATDIREADTALEQARQRVLQLLVSVPAALGLDAERAMRDADPHLAELVAEARQRWQELVAPPADGWTIDQLLARLAGVEEVSALVERVRVAAGDSVASRDAEWRPLAGRLSGWVTAARAAEVSSATAARAGQVEDFLKDAEAAIRSARFQPIADQAAALWAQLRQQSNVSLARVALEGRTTSRRVELDVTVDGTATSALGVMSQGEIHALALSLFLPRVTAAESPFRFLIIDDPVQAMDPARVDGLAEVLSTIAQDHQVIVFTHDDRLPASCRRLAVEAEIVEVNRQSGSRVTARLTAGPAERAIDDARILASTQRLPESLKQQIVPIHCRRALEAQARDLIWPRLLAAGHTPARIDELLDEATTTNDLLGLLFFGRPATGPDQVYRKLDELSDGMAKRLRFLNRTVHDPPPDLNPEVLTGETKRLMRLVRDWAG